MIKGITGLSLGQVRVTISGVVKDMLVIEANVTVDSLPVPNSPALAKHKAGKRTTQNRMSKTTFVSLVPVVRNRPTSLFKIYLKKGTTTLTVGK